MELKMERGADALPKHVRTFIAVALTMMCFSLANAGSPALQILVEGADDNAQRCGLSEESISSQVALTLRANGIRVREAQTNPYVYVNVNVVLVESVGVCVTNASVQVEGLSPDDLSAKPLGRFTARKGNRSTILCRSAGIATQSLRSNPGATILSHIETLTKTCLGKLDY